ncbi:SdrD B-like domain-containing protein [Azohydromonas aeria]|uniref:SdrD B-like domain-containing protein n=1 Tax=Azohydromonas aeria TaxID=2590212 RepID=UPI0018DFC952|nr:SdrD B-like domain-containing protein [Azohydromonas aeria]
MQTQAAKLGNHVWHDLNANGIQDAGEQGIAGATVQLVRDRNGDGRISADEVLGTTLTDASGYYSFKGLTPGLQYQVQFTQPTGFDAASPRQIDNNANSGVNSDGALSSVVVLRPGETNNSIDAGFYKNASLGDRVWEDTNGDGRQDAGEAGITGVTVNLRNAAGTIVATTTTDAQGNYRFDGLKPGTYDVQFVTPTGFTVTRQDIGSDAADSDINATGITGQYTLVSGDAVTTVDAGFYRTASLGDRLWLDANANGQQDDGEQGIAGQTVTLIGGGADGVIGTGDDVTVATMVTDANGNYRFTGLTPGVQYQVVFTKPAGTVFTDRDIGADATDSDADTATGKSQVVTLASGEDNRTVDAGVYAPASLGDRVWEDSNGDGRQDTGEAGIAGVTVRLRDANGVVVATTTTDAQGNYRFDGLKPGTYDVQFVTPTGFTVTRQDIGSDAADSDINATGITGQYTLVSGDAVTTVDAGFYRTASLGDRLWLDANANGQQDDGEQGIAGQTVTLIGGGADGVIGTGDDVTVATMVTDANGNYRFTGLTPGVQYQVVFTKPAGTVFTDRDIGADATDSDADTATGKSQVVTLTSGEDNRTVDAGVYAPASLGDRVWEDSNGDGRQDTGEAGIAGVTVRLRDANGVVVATTTTDATGAYSFTNLKPGTYDVQFVTPDGFTVTRHDVGGNDAADSDAGSNGITGQYTLVSGDAVTTVDAGFYRGASLGDRLWLDANANGQQDAGEAGIAGQTVTLIGGGADGVIGTGDDVTVATMVTDANGNYRFTGLTPGVQYQVVFTKPADTVFTDRDIGADATDSDADTATGKSQVVTLTSGEDNRTVDAGVYTPASLGDRVWEDSNGNGQQDAGEAGIAGVTVNLRDTAGAVIATTTTDAQGNYRFDGLKPGTYDVQFVTPNGFTVTRQDVGGNDATDSDANTNGITGQYTLVSGDAVTTVDAGFYRTASLGDRLWLDANANGQQDVGEAGIAGQAVTLIGGGADGVIGTADDTTVATMVTDSNGNYRFTGLSPGVQYQVVFTRPAGTVFTGQDVGADATDSDADTATGKSQVVTLASGEDNRTVDAGVYAPASLGDRVWEDTNGNGRQDAGEAGIAGVTVNLRNAAGTIVATTTTDAQGNYRFDGLKPGTYDVQFVTPNGFTVTRQDIGSDAADSDAGSNGITGQYTLVSGDAVTTVDAGFYRTASLGDRLWLDANANGQQDVGEAGIAGQAVTLIGGGADGVIGTGDDVTVATMVTDANGNYRFTGLTPGVQYQVVFTKPAGTVFTDRDIGADATDSDADTATGKSQVVTLASGEDNRTVDAGVYAPASLGDRVWEDSNGDGRQDTGEAGIAGVTVNLRNAAGAIVATTTTDAQGNYRFDGLKPGTYDVQFVTPNGFTVTRQDIGSDAADSDANSNGITGQYTLVSGDAVTTVDAGFYRGASLGDRLWLDANANGQQDAGEAGIAGQTVTLIGGGADGVIGTGDDVTVATMVTDANGNYRFTGLTPGVQYQVVFTKPAGTVFTERDIGADATDSDADTATGKSPVVTLTSGEDNRTVDAGVYTPASLGDRVWEDTNGNGQQDAGEAGIAGVTVNLRNAAGTIVATTTTDAQGNYRFDGLKPGTYDVQFVTPNGFTVTRQDIVSDAADSDANSNGITGQYTLVSGDAVTTVDAGFYKAAALGDRLWLDANRNGVQDAGEQGVAGQAVTLIGGGADGVIGTADDVTVATMVTDANGNYRFTGLTPGVQYQVVFGKPANTVFTPRDAGGDDAADSDVDTATGKSQVVTLASGEDNRTLDAGVWAPTVGIDIEKLVHGEYTVQTAGGGTEGLTPGFWKNHSSYGPSPLAGWPETGLSPDASYEQIFGVDVPGAAPTLLQALGAGGGGVNALLRHSAAALLNASNPNIDYLYTREQVVSMVKAAFASGSYDGTKDLFAVQNEKEADLTTPASGGSVAVVTADVDADSAAEAPFIQAGGKAVYTYVVKNTGNAEIADVRVVDDRIATLKFVGGDTDGDGRLDVGETWTYTASETVAANATVVNNATVTGRDVLLGQTVTDSDAAWVTSATASATTQTLGDRVWLDANGNGRQDAGEAGIAGVTVQLKSSTGTVLQTTTTDASGNYSFSVAAGTYVVSIVAPAGYQVTAKDQGGNDAIDSDFNAATQSTDAVTVTAGVQKLTVDAGLYQAASLGDRVWLDANGNGVQDSGEAGVSGVKVTLVGATGAALQTATTDASGNYLFTALTPGTYSVRFDLSTLPAGYVATARDAGGNDALDSDADAATGATAQVTLASGQAERSLDLGIKAGSLGIDVEKLVRGEYTTPGNGGGTEGLSPGFWKTHSVYGSAGLSGWPETGLSADASYAALFGVPAAGTATLYQALSTGGGGMAALMRQSAAALLNAANPYVDYLYTREQIVSMVQKAFATGDYATPANLFQAQNSLGADLSTPATGGASTVITADVDADTAGSGPVVPVGGKAVYTYVVKNTGTVALSNVTLGDDRLSGITFTGGDANANGRLDAGETWTYRASETVTSGLTYGGTATVTGTDATSGQKVSDSDAAWLSTPAAPLQSIGDRVWLDANANGLQDAGEEGLAGVTVQLRNTAGTVLQTAVTDANGNYAFNVGTGSYVVGIVTPTGWLLSGKDKGTNDALDSDFDPTTKVTAAVTVASGQHVQSVDAGLYQRALLTDRVWCDANGNGLQDSGEAGVSGVTVRLLDATGTTVLATTTTDTGGNYSFANLTPGNYRIQVVKPSGYQAFTTAHAGSNEAVDSDVDAAGLAQVSLASGSNTNLADAGFAPNQVSLTYSFDGSSATSGSYGNSRSWTVGGVTVTATAWSRDGNGTWSKAYLGAFSGGLGVTDSSESGSGVTHTIDNVGRYNFVVYQFSQSVVVDKAWLGYVYNDSDLAAFVGNSATSLTSLSDSALLAMSYEANDTTSTTTRWADLNSAGVAGNVLVIGASISDSTPDDYFKVSQLTVSAKSTTITPIAIDLDGDGVIQTVARADATGSFDLTGDGRAIASGWIAPGDALLAVDANGNGRIDDIHELFGGTAQGDGFNKLAAFDSNGDGQVDAQDARFGELLVWRDLDGNHQSSADELQTLAQAGVRSLNVSYTLQPFWDAQGNLHLESSSATMADGRQAQLTDVHFDTELGAVPALSQVVDAGASLDTLLGGSDTVAGAPATAAAAAAAPAATAIDAGCADAAELLRQLAAQAQQVAAAA